MNEEKTWKLLKELIKSQKETDKRMKETDRRIGKWIDGWGRFVEGIVAPSAVQTFRRKGYRVSDEHHRIKVWEDKRVVAEFDTLIEGEREGAKFLIIGEASSLCSAKDIDDFIDRLNHGHKYLPAYKGYKIIGFVAATNFGKGADKYAYRNGLYVFKPSGETMRLDVPRGFKPKIFV